MRVRVCVCVWVGVGGWGWVGGCIWSVFQGYIRCNVLKSSFNTTHYSDLAIASRCLCCMPACVFACMHVRMHMKHQSNALHKPALSEVTCGMPAPVKNAIIMTSCVRRGCVANYQCDIGYKGDSRESHCMVDGQWSHVTVNCSSTSPPVSTGYMTCPH